MTASEAPPIRLRAFYQTAGALLRELSRALSRGRTIIRAQSALPVGSRLGLVLQTPALHNPIEVMGTVTAVERHGTHHRITLRYDFDFPRFRSRLAQAIEILKQESPPRRPRLESRIPVALDVEAARALPSAAITVQNFSRAGCRLELRGTRLPRMEPGSRVEMTIGGQRGSRRLRVTLDVRWVAAVRSLVKGRSLVVGGRFAEPSKEARERIAAILQFEEYRPTVRLRRIVPRKK